MVEFLKRNRASVLCAAAFGAFLIYSWGPGPVFAAAICLVFLQGIHNDGKRAALEALRMHVCDGHDPLEAILYEERKMRRWFL
jgi:hypothetical protein